MRPKARAGFGVAEVSLILSHLVRVVDLAVVDAAGVDIERTTEIFEAHHRTFDVPAGESPSPWAVPRHQPATVRWGEAPKAEVPGLPLIGVGGDSGASKLGLKVKCAEPTVVANFAGVEVQAVFELIRESAIL